MKPCPRLLVALRGDEIFPRCGRPAREHRGHPSYQETTMPETTEPTREWIEKCVRELDSALVGSKPAAFVSQMVKDLAVYRMALRTLDAEAQLAAMTERAEEAEAKLESSRQVEACSKAFHDLVVKERDFERVRAARLEEERDVARVKIAAMTAQSESYKTMALSAARRVRDIHAIVCGEDDSLSPREQHEAIVDVLRGHHALGPWTAAEADLARKIASDPCVVSKRWPGGGVEHARIVGEEAERAERSHRTLCGDSAQVLMRKAIPWIAAMTERAERAEASLGAANAAVDALRVTVSILETDARATRDAAMTHAVEFMRGGETAAPAIERMATELREATERAERLQRHFDEAAPEHNLPALLDLYAERERAATERAEKAERELTGAVLQADVECAVKHELRAKLAEVERERDVSRSALNSIVSELRDALGDFPMVGEKWTDAVKRLRKQLAEVERERDAASFDAEAQKIRARTAEERLAEVERERDDLRIDGRNRYSRTAEILGILDGESVPEAARRVVAERDALRTKFAAMHSRAQRAESATAAARREAIGQRMRADWWRSEAKRLGWTPDYPELREEQTSDARIDCESSSLLLLSTLARRVMMQPKNRAKGVPSESVEELIVMARKELTEARDAIEEDATTDDILAELGDAAADIAFAMQKIEKRRKA